MTESGLYNFINGPYGVEYRWEDDSLVIWIPFKSISAFTEMVGEIYFENSLEVGLLEDCIAFDILKTFRDCEINLENVFQREDDKEDLKPCPFCGSSHVGLVLTPEYCLVECRDCGAEASVNSMDWRQAIAKWNRRADEQKIGCKLHGGNS